MPTAPKTVTLGRTGIVTNRNAFGALPIQRIPLPEAVALLRRAYEGGITFFDTARSYSDSEEKLGVAFSGMRTKLFLATKTPALNAADFWTDLETSLRLLKTDYVDLLQFHNPDFCPRPGGADGLYDAAKQAQREGKIRFIGISNHRLPIATEAVNSDLYDSLQFPFSYLAGEPEQTLYALCKEKNVGFIAMKALSGGLITNARAAYAYLATKEGVLPIWGMQRMEELEEFLSFDANPPELDEALSGVIARDRAELAGDFCRGCGYCQPCPVGIDIQTEARLSLLLRRSPTAPLLTKEFQETMALAKNCLHCNQCVSRCPYGLNAPVMIEKNYADYLTFL